MEMLIREKYENVAQNFFLSYEQLLQESLKYYLLYRKQELMNEKFEIFFRYTVTNVKELEEKIKHGVLPEHPTWEDSIDLRNLEREIQSIQDDINCL